MPSAPKRSMFCAATMTFGVLPPRALRMVAILLMFTLSAIMYSKFGCAKLGNIRIQFNVVERKMNVGLTVRL